MVEDQAIGNPHLLSQLPRSLNLKGRTFATEVYTLAGSKKRKRAELAVAIDGESVNVYNVQVPKFVTSYAISPQACFTCPPCSIRLKRTRTQEPSRITYCSVIDGPLAKIISFSEKETNANGHDIEAKALEVKSARSEIVHLDVLPGPSFTADEEQTYVPDILTVHKNGQIAVIPGSLEKMRWSADLSSSTQDEEVQKSLKKSNIVFATVMDSTVASKGVLSRRDDLKNSLCLEDEDTNSIQILLLVSKSSGKSKDKGYSYHIFALQDPQHGNGNSRVSNHLQHLMSSKLPQPTINGSTDEVQFSFHATSSILYQSSDSHFVAFDISGYTPSVSSELQLQGQESVTYLRLSESSVLVSSQSSITAYNTHYRSVQGSIDTSGSFPLASRDIAAGHSADSAIRLLAYFPKTNLIVGLKNGKLVGLQAPSSISAVGGGRKRKADSLLIDSIGRGLKATSLPSRAHQSKTSGPFIGEDIGMSDEEQKRWDKQKETLDALLSAAKFKEFTIEMGKEFGISKAFEARDYSTRNHHIQRAAQERSIEARDRPKILYLLSKIFVFSSPQTQKETQIAKSEESPQPFEKETLRLQKKHLRPLFSWLVYSGNFSESNIQLAIRQSSGKTAPPGSIVQALVGPQKEINLLEVVLENQVNLSTEELVQALKILIQIAEQNPQQKLLTNGTDPIKDLTGNELSTGFPPINQPVPLPPNVLTTLTLVIEKLNSKPPRTITKAIRSQLTRYETLEIISILQHYLTSSDWASDYLDATPNLPSDDATSPKQPQQPSVRSVIALLNRTITSFGASGFIHSTLPTPASSAASPSTTLSTTSLHSANSLLPSLQSTISTALEVCEESTYLRGLLTPLLTYATQLGDVKTAGHVSSKLMLNKQGMTIPLTASLNQDIGTGILPMAGKATAIAAVGKLTDKFIGAGGEIRQFQVREKALGEQKSKMVGKYQVERIVI
ncbi:MAG: hypothetical protein M1834_004763 [Cirrosporium novae-zelandiae]|nr:MAG: hypothetical protein M1834_004763 [Cirrosporium novae-zelandiae]